MAEQIDQSVLIVVKAYPEPSRRAGESSCTAGIAENGEWVRWFPLNWRSLRPRQKFQKYDWVRASVSPSRDRRRESFVPDPDTVQVMRHVGTAHGWKERRDVVVPHAAASMCELAAERDDREQSLGVVRVRNLNNFVVEVSSAEWRAEQEAYVRQLNLFSQQAASPLEKIPFQFSYSWTCSAPACSGHTQITVDWEVHQSYRNWSREYGAAWQEKMREKYFDFMRSRDLYFFVGTMFRHPGTWIVIGNFYPPRDEPRPQRQGALL